MTPELNLPLAKFGVDRDYLARERVALFDELAAEPGARVLALHQGLTLLNRGDAMRTPTLRLLDLAESPRPTVMVYLGRTTVSQGDEPAGTPVVLHVFDEAAAATLASSTSEWHHLRKTGAGLSDRDAGLFAQALALANWHSSHEFCPSCGATTEIRRAGWSRTCSVDGTELFPRTDPAIIVGVTDKTDRILLGSQRVWEENRYSILAGFVEPGESLEAAVTREMFEEAGVRVTEIDYLGSQAWPFPYSLMLGFSAKLADDFDPAAAVADGEEIIRLRWFTREELVKEAPGILLPARISISRAIIEQWLGYPVESATELGASR